MDGVLHGGGIEGPEPGGPKGYAGVEGAAGDVVDEDGGGGGEDAVDGEDDPGGEGRVDAEEFEGSGYEEGVEGRAPGSGAGVSDEGVGVAVAGGEGSGNTAHLPAELEVVLKDAEAVGVGESEVENAEEEAGGEETPGQPGGCVFRGEPEFEAGEHWG